MGVARARHLGLLVLEHLRHAPGRGGEPPTGACTATAPWPGSIDLGVAPVTGLITQNGAPLPLTTGAYDLLWQRAYQSSADYVSQRVLAPSPDPVVNGYRVVAACMLVP